MTTAASTPRPRSPVKAVLLSLFVLPGAGQWYNGQRLKAGVFCALTTVLFGKFIWLVTAAVNDTLNQALNAEDPALALSQLSVQAPPDSAWVSYALGLLYLAASVDAALTARRLDQAWKAHQTTLAPARPDDPPPAR